jgi:hypothetical protein
MTRNKYRSNQFQWCLLSRLHYTINSNYTVIVYFRAQTFALYNKGNVNFLALAFVFLFAIMKQYVIIRGRWYTVYQKKKKKQFRLSKTSYKKMDINNCQPPEKSVILYYTRKYFFIILDTNKVFIYFK